jgi:hypothetical protein
MSVPSFDRNFKLIRILTAVKLFIPRVQIFAISETIPFFLQLKSSNESLRAFISPDVQIPKSLKRASELNPVISPTKVKPTIRVFLYRQVRAEIDGQRAWRTIVLGEGKLCALAPTASFLSSSTSLDDKIETLEWEGEVRCDEVEVEVGGFCVGKLVVKVI